MGEEKSKGFFFFANDRVRDEFLVFPIGSGLAG